MLNGRSGLTVDASVLGLDPDSRMADVCQEILARRWDPRQSTAQPPTVCAHPRFQHATRRRATVCATCGWCPSVHRPGRARALDLHFMQDSYISCVIRTGRCTRPHTHDPIVIAGPRHCVAPRPIRQ